MKTSLNHSYRLVWSDVQQTFVPVPECASGRGKSSGGKASRITRSLLASLALTASVAHAQAVLPTGGQVVAGSASIATQGKSMTVTQTSDRMAADWQSFSIGKDHSVNFVQPSSSSVALNRVLGSDVSVIQGAINANGQVFLVNPNGVLFTKDAQVNVGAMVASTLNISTADFMAGNYKFEGASSNAIVNQGRMTAVGNGAGGGTVALIAAKITNEGSIHARAGSVLMGAGSKVTLDLGGPVKIQMEQGALDALITQGGAIKADGGLVYLSAKAAGDLVSTVINHTGVTEAQTLATGESGQMYLMGGMQKDRIEVGGKLDASAPKGGDGGFIETSSAKVDIQPGLKVSTKAENGKAGEWLIDPFDFIVASSGGNITGSALGTLLASNHITIQTANPEPSSSATLLAGTAGTNGDIFVNDGITWTSGKTLTLNAWRNIEINAPIDASGGSGGKLALQYGQGALASGNTATYTINAPVSLKASGVQDGNNGTTTTNFSSQLGSDGPVINYTVVNSQADLQGLALNGNYALGSSLTFSDNWMPIGNSWNSCSTMFCGNFDGLGNTISHLNIAPTTYSGDGVGFFGAANGATIQNLRFDQASVNITASGLPSYMAIGTLVGWQVGGTVVRNVQVNNSTLENGTNASAVGGLTGWLDNYGGVRPSVISQSSVHADVSSAGGYVGGLVGQIDTAQVLRSYASGSVTTNASFIDAGGLAGLNGGTIADSYAINSVTGAEVPTQVKVGGLVGVNNHNGVIERTYATGRVSSVTGSSTTYIGGLVGQNQNISGGISNSHWDADSTGQSSATGLDLGSVTVGELRSTSATINAYTQTTYTGFDFTNTWWMASSASRPFLRSEWRQNITNAHQLQLMAIKSNISYSLAKTIDLAPSLTNQSEMWRDIANANGSFQGSWIPIGNLRPSAYNATDERWRTTGSDNPFVGIFDGQNYSISGLTIQRPTSYPTNPSANQVLDSNGVGLFGYVSGSSSEIRNLTLINPDIKGFFSVGSVVGAIQDGSIRNLTVQNSQVEGSYSVGGIVGALLYDASAPVATNLQVSNGQVRGHSDVGGAVGINEGNISLSNAAVTVAGSGSTVGGLVGDNYGVIDQSSASGAVTGGSSLGGLVGSNGGTISSSFASGNVTNAGRGTSNGGLVGSSDGIITDSHATGDVVTPATGFTGGLVGSVYGGQISRSYATGSVQASSLAGGLVGYSESFSGRTNNLIEKSYATGAVTASADHSGGLVGRAKNTNIQNSYATSTVSGTGFVGGLVGEFQGGSESDGPLITNSFAAGAVTGTSNVGGLVGRYSSLYPNDYSSTRNSYWDTTTTGQSTSQGGVGKTTAQMKDIALYSAWNIEDDQTLSDGYPRLTRSADDAAAVWKIKSVADTTSSSGGSSSNTDGGGDSTGGSDSSGGSSSGGSSSGGGSSGGGSSGGSSSNTGTGGNSTDSSSTGESGIGNNDSTTDQTAGNGGGNSSGTGSSNVPPTQPTNTAEEQQRQAAIQAAQSAVQVAAQQVSGSAAGSSGVAGNPALSSSMSTQLGAGSAGTLTSLSLSGGLAFVNVSQSQGTPETSSQPSAQATDRTAQVAQDGAGRDASGFMRVFVVNGGISLPPQINEAEQQ